MINSGPGSPAIYLQVAAQVRNDITSGRLRPGQPIPSEQYLSQQFGVSRQTARQAVMVLRNEGLVVFHRGLGIRVREPEQMSDLTPAPGSIVTSRMPSAEERAEHAIDEGVPVLVVTAADGSTEVFPADRWHLRWPPQA